ncbi:hypothetical protein Hanom_Chr13g01238431 [Helianthus anomalus]
MGLLTYHVPPNNEAPPKKKSSDHAGRARLSLVFVARNDLVQELPSRIQAIPDGAAAAPKQTGGWAASASRTNNNIKFDSDGRFDDEYFQQSEESSKFRNEYEMRKNETCIF